MEKGIRMLLVIVGLVLFGVSLSYAAQAVVLDPISSYEFKNSGAPFIIPIGATFVEPVATAQDYDLFAEGLPAGIQLSIRKISPFRISASLR
jgi:hypothetical protein